LFASSWGDSRKSGGFIGLLLGVKLTLKTFSLFCLPGFQNLKKFQRNGISNSKNNELDKGRKIVVNLLSTNNFLNVYSESATT
jgi:hypothetical protein